MPRYLNKIYLFHILIYAIFHLIEKSSDENTII